MSEDTPSTEARPHDPFCVMFGINDLMRGKESGCTCATRRSDTPSTEALTPEAADTSGLREALRITQPVYHEETHPSLGPAAECTVWPCAALRGAAE